MGTVPELEEQRYFSYRAPFARGVDLTHQITDLLGLAMGGGDGTTTQLMDQQVTYSPTKFGSR